jgi:hypothetical protein
MNVLDQVRKSLKTKHPDLQFTDSGLSIVVHASKPLGFDVGITGGSGQWIVSFDGWHEHIPSDEAALKCFAFGFSDHCRLRVSLRGDFAYKWTMESLEGGQWVEDSTTGLLLFPFWRAGRTEYRGNGLITLDTPENRTPDASA